MTAVVALLIGVVLVALGWAIVDTIWRDANPKKAQALMATLATRDAAWDEEAFLRRVREVFQAVYPLSAPAQVDAVAAHLTPAYRQRLTANLSRMQAQGRVRRPGRADIHQLQVVHVDDRLDDAQDRAWVLLSYFGDEALKEVQSGWPVLPDPGDAARAHRQVWKFLRMGDAWVLEDVAVNADVGGLGGAKVQSEEPPAP